MRKAILMLFLAVVSGNALADTSYLCVADKSTGFRFDKIASRWEIANFDIRNDKYVISKSTIDDYAWEVKVVGDKVPVSLCKDDFSKYGQLYCEGFQDFNFSRENGRFLAVYKIGYWDVDMTGKDELFREGANTPSMKIGKCSPL